MMPPWPICWHGPRESDLDNLVANWNVQRLTIRQSDPRATPPVPEIKEDDEALILRALMAWDGLSVAGPTGAYEYFALSADGKVADAKGSSPSGAVAIVTILSTEGDGTADAALIAKVDQALSHEDRAPGCRPAYRTKRGYHPLHHHRAVARQQPGRRGRR